MNAQQNIQNLLNRKLMEYRSVNPSFSMRALAKKIGMQPSATNEILKGERRISKKVAEKIATNLMLDPTERAELLATFPEKLKRNTSAIKNKDIETEVLKLNSMQFQAISDSIHYSILSLMNTKNFISDIDWMANRLNQSANKVSKALETLEGLSLIKKTNLGEYKRTSARLNTTDDVLNISIQKSHIEDMEIAKEKLLNTSVELRDFTSFTLPVDPELLGKAKEIIRKAQDDLAALMETGNATEVYKTSTYLYPITNLQ